MPNFHVHWLVAWQALDGIQVPAASGRDAYAKAGRRLADDLHSAVGAVRTAAGVQKFFAETLPDSLQSWRDELAKTPAVRDEVTCFSAYMLGACGPDFWTVTTESYTGALPDMASHHFDLGHYNRTQEQFRVSIERVGATEGLQAEAERSYFLGMATHVASDLVLHQLVNVSAGAYNLLKKKNWQNEHIPALIKLWNTHNKVEHFWDSYVRARYFGDLTLAGQPVLPGDTPEWIAPLGFPLAETLVARARKIADPAVRDAFLQRLLRSNPERHRGKQEKAGGNEIPYEVRVPLELPLLFPAIFCDRILGGAPAGAAPLLPFIYDRVVHETDGAYPSAMLYADAAKEKSSAQMVNNRKKQVPGKLNEVRKLSYFATEKNRKTALDWSFHNYLTYAVCPDVERLRESGSGLTFGKDAFYDLAAVDKFGARAVEAAKSFTGQLAGAYKSRSRSDLRDLDRFWNLDTGLGLDVRHVPSSTDREVITRLDFMHVFDGRLAAWGGKTKGPAYARAAEPGGVAHLGGKKPDATTWSTVAATAFPIRPGAEGSAPDGVERPFERLGTVEEKDTTAFLDRIRVAGPSAVRSRSLAHTRPPEVATEAESVRAEKRTGAWLDAFFARQKSPTSWRHPLATVRESVEREQWALQNVRHRLTLELRVPVLDLGGDAANAQEPALLFYCDDAIGKAKASTDERGKWLEDARLVGYQTEGVRDGPLKVFTARILVNVTQEEDRLVGKGTWNNVVPYGEQKRFYGRNFAVATGRRFVLAPKGGGLFDPTADFAYYDGVSPTEHVFLSIYPLVRTPNGVFDLFSKEDVTRDEFDGEIRRISGLEWKKVVLLYQFDGGGLVQLDRAFVDGIDVAVQPG